MLGWEQKSERLETSNEENQEEEEGVCKSQVFHNYLMSAERGKRKLRADWAEVQGNGI